MIFRILRKKRRDIMAGSNKHGGKSSNYVDINSNTQVIKTFKKKGRVRRALAIVLVVLLMLTGSGMIYYYNALDSLNFEELEEETVATEATAETVDEPGDINTTLSESDLLSDSKILNIMLFGEDNHSKNSTGRSDSMILCSIDNRAKAIKLTSFQRDTYVYIPGYGYNKINASYSYGGASLAIKTVEANFGIKIDRYAVVDFSSFKKIIDVLGGVTMNITAEEAGYINWQMYINKQASDRNTLEEVDGKVKLNGQEALWYARNRGFDEKGYSVTYSGDDWDRTKRQRKLLQTIFKSLKKANLAQIVSIVSEVGPLVTTNLKKDEITGLVSHALSYVKYDVKQYNVPQDGVWSYDQVLINGWKSSIIRIDDMDSCREKLAKFVFGDALKSDSD
jgi:LCP family protein required for cell wall assembly